MLSLLFLPLVVAAAVIASAKAGWKSTLAYGGVASLAFGIIGATLLEIPHGAIPPLALGIFLGGLSGIGVLAGVGLQRLWVWLNRNSEAEALKERNKTARGEALGSGNQGGKP